MPLILLRKKKYKDATLKTLIYLLTRLRKNEKTAFLLEIKNILAGKIKVKDEIKTNRFHESTL
jgi:hypothetical protein